MRHTCEYCQTNYEIADEKVAGRFVKVRCQQCHGTMHVVGLEVRGVSGERYWCAIHGQPKGPFSREEIELFVELGDVAARTRMWRTGMKGWERVCESTTLSWVYARIVETMSADDVLLAREPTRNDPFANAALLTDGLGWFPDPTLKSGIFILDQETQTQLEHLHQTGVFQRPTPPSRGAMPALMAAAAGAAMAVGGFIWLLAENLV